MPLRSLLAPHSHSFDYIFKMKQLNFLDNISVLRVLITLHYILALSVPGYSLMIYGENQSFVAISTIIFRLCFLFNCVVEVEVVLKK